MKLLFVADGRSPIALNWINYFIERGHEVHLASTYLCEPDLRLASATFVPVAFSSVKSGGRAAGERGKSQSLIWGASVVRLRTAIRQWLAPFTLPQAARYLRTVIEHVQPDLIHAMRIPYEGMLAASANPVQPVLVSVWGNDFTLHASSTPWMSQYTRRTLRRADAVHTDCQRDLRLAHRWGFPAERPAMVLPGGGGVQPDMFYPAEEKKESTPVVINPRSFRAYVRNDTFFRAIPLVLERLPQTRFVCPAMADEPQVLRWLDELDIHAVVELLPKVDRSQMAELFRRAQVAVSITTHDGTPNTLLEAMACGCFPIAGDLESLREWITPKVNGTLVDPADPHALAQAILQALEQPELRHRAAQHNTRLIAERAEYRRVMGEAERFYLRLIGVA